MTQNVRALLSALGAVALVLVVGGLGFDWYENDKFSKCVQTYEGYGCDDANRFGLLVFAFGAILLIGVAVGWFVLRRGASTPPMS